MAKIPEGLSCAVTPEQAYPNGVPLIPESWEFVRFSNAYSLAKEEFVLLDVNGVGAPIQPGHPEEKYKHWIIVRRKPKPKPEPLPPPSSPWTEEEMNLANEAARIVGFIPADQILSVSDMELIVMRLRAIDRAKLLAAEISTMYKLVVNPKPTICPGNPGIMPTPHCPCTDKCCFCHYEEREVTRARRWLVEFPDLISIPVEGHWVWHQDARIIREVKPITREDIEVAIQKSAFIPYIPSNTERIGPEARSWAIQLLLRLGIEVED